MEFDSKHRFLGAHKFMNETNLCRTLIFSSFLDWFMHVLSLNPEISQEIVFIGQ